MSDHIDHDEPDEFRALIEHIMRVEGVPYAVARTRAFSYWHDPIWREQQRAIGFWKFMAWLLLLLTCLVVSGIAGLLWGLFA